LNFLNVLIFLNFSIFALTSVFAFVYAPPHSRKILRMRLDLWDNEAGGSTSEEGR